MKIHIRSKIGGREAFTLAETMVASGIFITVMATTLSVFLGAQRMLESAMAQTQIAFELRMLREKLLFRIDADGGLMSARQSTVALGDASEGWGKSISFMPLDAGQANTVTLPNAPGRLEADHELASSWLGSGQIRLASPRPFQWQRSEGKIEVDANATLVVGGRTYSERQAVCSQIMAP